MPPLCFLIIVGFLWALSLLPYHKWGSGGPFLRILIIVRAGVSYGTLPNLVWSWRALYALDRFSVWLEIPIISCFPKHGTGGLRWCKMLPKYPGTLMHHPVLSRPPDKA
jgi:hypothetical protein